MNTSTDLKYLSPTPPYKKWMQLCIAFSADVVWLYLEKTLELHLSVKIIILILL